MKKFSPEFRITILTSLVIFGIVMWVILLTNPFTRIKEDSMRQTKPGVVATYTDVSFPIQGSSPRLQGN